MSECYSKSPSSLTPNSVEDCLLYYLVSENLRRVEFFSKNPDVFFFSLTVLVRLLVVVSEVLLSYYCPKNPFALTRYLTASLEIRIQDRS